MSKDEIEVDTKTEIMNFDEAMDVKDKEVIVNGKALKKASELIEKTDEKIMSLDDISIYEKLNIIQSELIAPKGQFNAHGKYNYRSCEDIVNAVKPSLKKYNLVLLLSDSIEMSDILETEIVIVNKQAKEVQTQKTYIKATARLIDYKGGDIIVEAFARESSMKTGMALSQLTGATSSYARKYALNGLFAIDDTKDADTMDNSHNGANLSPQLISKTQYDEAINLITAKGLDAVAIATSNGMSGLHQLQAQNFQGFMEWLKVQ